MKTVSLLCGLVTLAYAAAPLSAAKHTVITRSVFADMDIAPAVAASAKVIEYGDKDLVSVKTKVRFTTLLVLPKNEQILDFACGDKEFWVINGPKTLLISNPQRPAFRPIST